MTVTDDLGHPLADDGPRERVVSLVPSLTEALATMRPDALVGATDWCTHPADLSVARVRGTKNPDLTAIAALRPDLVVANQEENRRLDVERLRAMGLPVWVTRIETVPEALASMRRLFEIALQWGLPAWLQEADTLWRQPAPVTTRRRVAVPIWRDPWMVIGPRTFTGDLLARCGLDNVFADHTERYPHVSVDDIRDRRPDLVLLPDEPYRFTADDGPEAFPRAHSVLVDGRAITWYGPLLLTARDHLLERFS